MKKNNSQSIVIVRYCIVIILLFGLLSCEKQTEKAVTFRIGYLDITASAPLFIAQDLNLFNINNVTIEIQKFASSDQLIDAIAADKIDYVVEASAAPALALQLKSPGRFFVTAASTISEQEPFDAILVHKDSGIETLKDLEGKKISVFPGTTALRLLKTFLEDEGINTSGINFLPTPAPNLLASVKSKAADATHVYEPAWTIGINDPELKQIHGTVYGAQVAPNPQGVSLLNSKTAKSYPESSKSLVSIFDQALTFMKTDEDSCRAILKEYFQLPGNTVEEMHFLYMSPHDKIDWKSFDVYIELLIRAGELDGKPGLNELKYK